MDDVEERRDFEEGEEGREGFGERVLSKAERGRWRRAVSSEERL